MEREWKSDTNGVWVGHCEIGLDTLKDKIHSRTNAVMEILLQGASLNVNLRKTFTENAKNDKTAVDIQADLEETGVWKGTLEITRFLGKIEKNHLLIHFNAGAAEPIRWTPEAVITKELSSSDEEQLRIMEAACFLQSLALVPAEELDYILSGLPEELWSQLPLDDH